jgi:hypothetical protein
MEMRGEKVDVNSIRQNVQEGMGDVKARMQSWGEEVKTSAQNLGNKASEFANTRGRAFASDVSEASRPAARGCFHAIAVIIKAFFIFVAGCITLSLFAALMAILFGGVAFWPINNFLWTSSLQKILAWGTIIFFIGVPIVGFMTWLIRRIVRVRSRSRYLGWTFGGLWTLGWICAVCFAISIAKDVREYERVSSELSLPQTATGKMIVSVNEPEIRYSGGFEWMRHDNTGWDISDDSLKYNNVKVRINKSDDSLYHATLFKYSFGSSIRDAQERAEEILFHTSTRDSVLNIGSGLHISSHSKFRGQGVIIDIMVPVGKKIQFDESIIHAYNPWVVRKTERYKGWQARNSYEAEWDYDHSFDFDPDIEYIMTSDEKLVRADRVIIDSTGVHEIKSEKKQLKDLEEKQRKNEREREEIERERNRLQLENRRDSNSTGYQKPRQERESLIYTSFSALII